MQLLRKILGGEKTLLGVDLYYLSKSEVYCSYVKVCDNAGRLKITDGKAFRCHENELSNKLPKLLPVFLSLRGKAVVSKKINRNSTNHNGANAGLIGFSEGDYYKQNVESDNESCFISLIRRTHLDHLLSELSKNDIAVNGVCLGSFSVVNLIDSGDKEKTIVTPYEDIRVFNNRVTAFEVNINDNSPSLQYGGQNFRAEEILPFVAVLESYLVDSYLSGEVMLVNKNSTDYSYKRKTRAVGIISLLVLLGVLLINYTLYSFQEKKNSELNRIYSQYREDFEKLDRLKKDYQDKKSLIVGFNISGSDDITKYADIIGYSLPTNIILQNVTFQPLLKDVQQDKAISLDKDKIKISGYTKSSMLLGKWIDDLRINQWVKNVEITKFSAKETNRNYFEFEILLNK